MQKKLLVPSLVVAALLTGSLALAGPHGFGKGGFGDCDGSGQGAMNVEQHTERMEHKLEMMATVLELNDEQRTQLETLFNQRWQANQPLRDQLQASRAALRAAQKEVTFNETEFRAKAAEQAGLKTEMMVQKAKFKREVYALLTPEQREKADKLGGLLGGHGNGRHGGPGHGF